VSGYADAVQRCQARTVFDAVSLDPSFFAQSVLGWTPWSRQREILKSAREHRRTLVMSGHGVGKTRTLASLICETMVTEPDCRIVCMASTYRQVHDALWGEVQKLYRDARLPLGGRMGETDWTLGDGSRASIVAVDDPTALQGIHSRRVLVIVDEAEGVDPRMWGAIDSLLSSGGSSLVVAFNPVTPSGYLFDAHLNPQRWNVIKVSCLEHPNVAQGEEIITGAVTREWVEEVRAREGEDSPFWASRVCGQFPAAGSDSLVSVAELEATENVATGVREPRRIGLDVARMGGDANVLVVLDETRRLVAVESWRGEDLMQTTGRLIDAMRRHGVEGRNVCVDSCGIGAGVVDRLREQNIRVTAVDFGAGAVGDWQTLLGREAAFPNRRCELHAALRSVVRARQISIPSKFREVIADLASVRYWYDSRGRFTVEPKDAIRARIRRSPDFGDALVIALGSGLARKVAIL